MEGLKEDEYGKKRASVLSSLKLSFQMYMMINSVHRA